MPKIEFKLRTVNMCCCGCLPWMCCPYSHDPCVGCLCWFDDAPALRPFRIPHNPRRRHHSNRTCGKQFRNDVWMLSSLSKRHANKRTLWESFDVEFFAICNLSGLGDSKPWNNLTTFPSLSPPIFLKTMTLSFESSSMNVTNVIIIWKEEKTTCWHPENITRRFGSGCAWPEILLKCVYMRYVEHIYTLTLYYISMTSFDEILQTLEILLANNRNG